MPDAPLFGMTPDTYVPHRHHWNDWFRPIEPPPQQDWPAHGPEPIAPVFSPVRDDSKVGPTEDLDREPDGVPHAVVGATAGFAVVLSLLIASAWFVSSWTMRVGVILLVAFAVPVVVTTLKHKADRDRDHVHPSR
jgi:hypothetical protein